MDELETKLNRPAQEENKEVDPNIEKKEAFDLSSEKNWGAYSWKKP